MKKTEKKLGKKKKLKNKKIKSTNNFEKNHNKKTIRGNNTTIHNVLKKKIIKLIS
jgi:hypothetical protein